MNRYVEQAVTSMVISRRRGLDARSEPAKPDERTVVPWACKLIVLRSFRTLRYVTKRGSGNGATH
jgi:hypothetical protein